MQLHYVKKKNIKVEKQHSHSINQCKKNASEDVMFEMQIINNNKKYKIISRKMNEKRKQNINV